MLVPAVLRKKENDKKRGIRLSLHLTAIAFSVPVSELEASTRRKAPVALARQVAMYLVHVTLGMNLTHVGRAFGRDRSTASHACQHIEELRDDLQFDRLLECLEHTLKTLVTQPRPYMHLRCARDLSLASSLGGTRIADMRRAREGSI